MLLNQIANAVGRFLLAPLGFLPEVAGAVIVAVVTGVLMLIAFKYTSHQSAIKQIRNGIKAELLALSLFKDSIAVSLRSQWRIIQGAMKLILISLIPIGCMMIPVTLLLGQLSLWWQARPLQIGEDVVVTLALNENDKTSWPNVTLQTAPAMEITQGPFRIRSRRELCWQLQARAAGYHRLNFLVDGQPVEKELAAGSGTMRVSIQRPGWHLSDILMNPAEAPFQLSSKVNSIRIQYPMDTTWTHGRYSSLFFHSWLVFWFIGSTISAFCFRGILKVNL